MSSSLVQPSMSTAPLAVVRNQRYRSEVEMLMHSSGAPAPLRPHVPASAPDLVAIARATRRLSVLQQRTLNKHLRRSRTLTSVERTLAFYIPRLTALGLLSPGRIEVQSLSMTKVLAMVSAKCGVLAFNMPLFLQENPDRRAAVVLHELLHTGAHDHASVENGGALMEATATYLCDALRMALVPREQEQVKEPLPFAHRYRGGFLKAQDEEPVTFAQLYRKGFLVYDIPIALLPLYLNEFRSLRGPSTLPFFEWLRQMHRFDEKARSRLTRTLERALSKDQKHYLRCTSELRLESSPARTQACNLGYHTLCGHTLLDSYLLLVSDEYERAKRNLDFEYAPPVRIAPMLSGIVEKLAPALVPPAALYGFYYESLVRMFDPTWAFAPRSRAQSLRKRVQAPFSSVFSR